MKKKVFITGISSAIMQKLVSFIDSNKYEIIGLSRKQFSHNFKKVTIIQGNLLDVDTYSNHLKNCHLIIHAAAITHSFDEKMYFDINYKATKKLVNVARKYKVGTFVFISSNTSNAKNGAYSHSKILAEEYIQKNLDTWQILRISEIFGGDKNEGLEKLIQDALYKKHILCPKNIPSKFSPIFIEDAVKMMVKNIFDTSEKNKIIQINGSEHFTFQEICFLIKNLKNTSLKIIYINKKIMFLLMNITSKIPFNIGLIPDQIVRLYGVKSIGEINENEITLKLKEYIHQKIKNNKDG